MRLMGLDYGDKRIGVSVSDPLKQIAFGVEVIQNKGIEHVIGQIKAILERYGDIEGIVVGLPFNMKGEEGFQAKKVEGFIKDLKPAVNIPILTTDERFTTVETTRLLHDAGLNSRQMKGIIDEASAMTILQGYLDSGK